ncbi:hypothetical protein [Jatrophihabitans sp.]|nr:hypothetical protein [Jatrophihabitans sp.]
MDLSPGRSISETRVRLTSLLASFVLALTMVRLASSARDELTDAE